MKKTEISETWKLRENEIKARLEEEGQKNN